MVFLYFPGPEVVMQTNLTAPAPNATDETSTSVIIGGAAAGAVVAIAMVVIAVVLYRKRKSSGKSDSSGETYMYSPSTDSVYTEPDYMVSSSDYYLSQTKFGARYYFQKRVSFCSQEDGVSV